MVRWAHFILVGCFFFASALAHAKHSASITYKSLPEYKTHLEKVLTNYGYTFSPLTDDQGEANAQITSGDDSKVPSPDFLIDLFFSGFVEDIHSTAPVEGERMALQIRVAEMLHREELIELFSDLQKSGAWIEYASLTPAFNFIINFSTTNLNQIMSTLAKYEYIDQYHSDTGGEKIETHFLNDPKRRGTTQIKLTLMVQGMIPKIMERIPAKLLAMCIDEAKTGSEFEKLTLACPNEFSIIQGIVDSLAGFEQSQSIRIDLDDEYTAYSTKRDQSYMIETKGYKRLVLELRLVETFEAGKNSEKYKELAATQDESEKLNAEAFKIGIQIMRQSVTDSGYDVFKIQMRRDSRNVPAHQIFIELPEAGISRSQLDQLLVNFRVFPYLDNGQADLKNEFLDSAHENCESFLIHK